MADNSPAGDAFRKPVSGQRVPRSARTWQAIFDTIADLKNRQHDRTSDTIDDTRQTGIVLIRNDSGAARDRFDVLQVTTPIILPSERLTEFQRQIALAGTTPAATGSGTAKIAVLLEPLAANKIGKAVLAGLTLGRVLVAAATAADTMADVIPGDATQLQLSAGGVARVVWYDPTVVSGTAWAVLRLEVGSAGGVTTTAASGGTTALGSTSSPIQDFTGSANQTVQLGTSIISGSSYTIINSGTGLLTLTNSSGTIIGYVYPGTYLTATVTATGAILTALVSLLPGLLPTQTVATSGGTTTLTSLSPATTTFTGTSNQTTVLPDATTVAAGWPQNLVNNSTGTITVQTYGGATLATVPPGAYLNLSAATVATSAGTWNVSGWGATGTATTGSTWIKVSQDYTAFQAAGTTKTITLLPQPPGGNQEAVKYRVTTAFSGGGSTYTATIGFSGAATGPDNTSAYGTGITLGTTTTLPLFSTSGQPDCEHETASWNVTMTALCVGGGSPSLNNLTQGHIDIWLKVSTAA